MKFRNHLDHKIKNKMTMIKSVLELMVKNYFAHNVGRNAAALAYYLIFALFPLMIFFSNLLGLLELNITEIMQILQRFLPREIINLLESYLEYVSHTSSHTMLWFALIFSIWFPMRAVKGLMDGVRHAYHLGKPKRPFTYTLRQLGYTVVLLLVIVITLSLSVFGKRVLTHIIYLFVGTKVQIWYYLLGIWQYVRFIPVGCLMYAALGTLYAAALDKRPSIKALQPGIMTALISWMVVSILFSFYVEYFANYSLIYGTLGAVIMLLIWLYITAALLIMGAELNAALLSVRNQSLEERDCV